MFTLSLLQAKRDSFYHLSLKFIIMTFLLTNSQKIEILDNNCIPFTFAKNIIFVGFLNVTTMSDENFSKIVLNYDFNN